MITTGRYSPDVKERAVRVVLEHEREIVERRVWAMGASMFVPTYYSKRCQSNGYGG